MKFKATVLLAAVVLALGLSPGSQVRAENPEVPAALEPEAGSGAAIGGTLPLSLQEAMDLAANQSVASRLAEEKSREAQSIKSQRSAGLLPHLSAGVSQYDQTLNLAALGFTPSAFPAITDTFLGPFGVFDARISLVQKIFDLTALSEHQAGKVELRKARIQEDLARQQSSLQSGLIYLELLRVRAGLRGFESDVKLAETNLQLIRNQQQSGLSTNIDVTRAQTQVSQSKSQLVTAQTRKKDAELRLKRSLGLPLDTTLRLTDQLSTKLVGEQPLDPILAQAQEERLEIQVAKQEILRTKAEQKAALGRQIPSLVGTANYGGSGNRPNLNLDDTYQFGVALNIPVFDGGATLGRINQTKSQSRQAEIILGDIKTQVEQDVRLAYQNLVQSEAQLRTSEQTYQLARRELELVRDQYRSGLGDSLALVTSENSLTRAREEYLSALSVYHASRLMLAYSIGEMKGFKI